MVMPPLASSNLKKGKPPNFADVVFPIVGFDKPKAKKGKGRGKCNKDKDPADGEEPAEPINPWEHMLDITY